MPEPVRYRIRFTDLHRHLVDVAVDLPPAGGPVDVWLPTWTPGSYLVRELARHVQDVAASDDRGRTIPVERRDKNTWRLRTPSSGTVTLRYRVYANDLSVRTAHVDDSHAFLNGTCVFVTADAWRELPCRVVVEPPAGWTVFTALDESGGELHAAHYDELVDSPIEVGPHDALRFEAGGLEHRLVIWGTGNHDKEALVKDLARICHAEISLFGGSPVAAGPSTGRRRYTFILLTTDKGRGGLEHANSTALLYPRFAFRPRKAYEDFLSLAAHEYFHLWNVKRIKPRAFVPYAYQRENYTALLWAMEGITSYYDTLMLRRADLISAKRYLEKVGEALTSLARTPGRRALSLADASLLTWVKYYRPDENSPNSQVSYYVKGEVVAMLLDLVIRQRTRGARSLDDVMRLLFARFGRGEGVPEDGVESAASEVAGESLAPFFERAIRSTEELDYSAFASVGLAIKMRPATGPADKGGTPPATETDEKKRLGLGFTTKPLEPRVVVASVLADSPAAAAGLYADDEIIAIDGYRVDAATWLGRLQDNHRAGDEVTLTVFRRDELRSVRATVGSAPADTCYLQPLPAPTPEARAAYEAWLGEPFPDATKS